MTDQLRQAAQQALEALESGLAFDTHSDVLQNLRTALRTALEQQQQAEPVSGCVCRWDHEDNRVVTCERHQGWLDVIAEWADRAREAEAKLKAAQPEQQAEPVFENLDYVAVVYSPSNAMLKSPLPIGTHLYKYPPQRQWVGLTDEDFLEACQLAERGNYLVAFQRIQTKLKERNNV